MPRGRPAAPFGGTAGGIWRGNDCKKALSAVPTALRPSVRKGKGRRFLPVRENAGAAGVGGRVFADGTGASRQTIGERGLVVKARFRFCLLLSAAALVAVAALVFFGVLPLNAPPENRYPVRGVDVSAHQGVIDWPTLAAQGVEFAFVKATEGSGFTDARFSFNVLQARNAGLRVGAYHFFSFESSGDAQADNFIAAVEPFEGMLPPVVDLEYYAGFFDDPPAAEPVRAELDALLERLRTHYGVQPILYVTEASYTRYIAGVPAYAGLDIWIRSVYRRPRLEGWTFWQYSNRARLDGYDGDERYIDLNVFCGSRAEFEEKYPA